MIIQALACLALALPAPFQERQSGDQLIEQAWTFLPAYTGTHRFLLTEQAERETRAGAHLLQAGLALEPDHIRGLWSLGHAQVLLAENHRNRGQQAAADEAYGLALGALSRAIELNPTDAWSPYARAMAHTSAGQQQLALADLKLALAKAQAAGQTQDAMRFRALEWLPEVLMRSGRHAEARAALRSFHSEFSNNTWPMLIALGESFQRERNFAGAREIYQQTIQEYPSDFQAYALMGYLDGISGQPESAAESMRLAIRNERFAGMYTRLWLVILATPELEEAALKDLTAFLKNPPDSASEWDRTLGRFVIGQLTPDAFRRAAKAERERRYEAAEPMDELWCEVSFYMGLRAERDAAALSTAAERSKGYPIAVQYYRDALKARPNAWKWEWAYARLGLARLAKVLGVTAPSAEIASAEGTRWHRAGQDQAQEEQPSPLEVGDLVIPRGARMQIIGNQ